MNELHTGRFSRGNAKRYSVPQPERRLMHANNNGYDFILS
jgi:hypothetical protein